MRAMNCQTIRLSSGYDMPTVGLGTSLGLKNDTKEAVIAAIESGYRHVDCALIYRNELDVGDALKTIIPSKCKREDLFITSKLWLTDFDADEVEAGLFVSLKKLGLDYLDLYLIHWPIKQILKTPKRDPNDIDNWLLAGRQFDTIPYSRDWYLQTWKAMEKCVEKGLVRSIGVSNMSIKKLEEILPECAIKPAVNQIEMHPGLSQSSLVNYCRDHDILVTAYCPLGSPGRPITPDAPNYMDILSHPVILVLSEKYKKTPAQICIRWCIDRGVSVIPKSIKPARIRENINVFDFSLAKGDVEEIDKMDCDFRIIGAESFFKDDELGRQMWE